MVPQKLLVPKMLKEGDTIAVVSPSWGGPHDEPENYRRSKTALRDFFNLTVVDMPHAKRSPEYLQKNPQARAEDIIMAFEDNTIKGIIASIGGLDSIRLLPHMDWSVMTDNPKVFMGFSDTTCVHFMCRKAGMSSFYGPSMLANFATDPVLPYTVKQTSAALFQHHTRRSVPFYDDGYPRRVLQGSRTAEGRLLGGCIETFEMMASTMLWPEPHEFDNAILFIETVPSFTTVEAFKERLRAVGRQGIYERLNGVLFGRVGDGKGISLAADRYNAALREVIGTEFGCKSLPVFINVEFGHTQPMTVLPYGALVEMDTKTAAITFKEPIVKP